VTTGLLATVPSARAAPPALAWSRAPGAVAKAVGRGARGAAPPSPTASMDPRAASIVRLRPVPAIVPAVAVARPDLEAERALCDRAGAGDRVALGQILRTYGPILYRSVLLPRLGSEAVAQDALAETYARVL
jgi:hypothetical protein